MGIINSNVSNCGLVEKYIGTAYDNVKKVGDNMEGINEVVKIIDDGSLQEILDLAEDITVAALLINYKGAWDPAVEYIVGDSVSHGDSLWLVTTNNLNSEPAVTNPYWWHIPAPNIGAVATVLDLPEIQGLLEVIVARGFVAPGDGGGGVFEYVEDMDRTLADGGIVIDPTNTGTGTGCWVREFSGPINVKWYGATGDGVTDDTISIKNASNAFTRTHPYGGLKFSGVIYFPEGDYMVRDLRLNRGNIKLLGAGSAVSRLISDISGTAITFQPLLNGSPNTNGYISKFFMEDIMLYAASDGARQAGTGLHLINAMLGQFENCNLYGFQTCLFLSGIHFIKLSMCEFQMAKDTVDHPAEAIHYKGYGIKVDTASTNGQPVSSGFQLNGGWVNNSSLDLANCHYAVLNNFDIEPASNTVKVGRGQHWTNCRFERFEYYALDNPQPGVDRFVWFDIEGDDNLFEHNSVHFNGANNDIYNNPIFNVLGNRNSFKFSSVSAHYGLMKFGLETEGNYVEYGPFKDYDWFNSTYPHFHVENLSGIFRGNGNGYALNEHNSYIKVAGKVCTVVGAVSLDMPANGWIQGATKVGNIYTVASDPNHRILFNWGITEYYKPGHTYAMKMRVSCNDGIGFKVAGEYADATHMQVTEGDMHEQFLVVRFHIPLSEVDVKIQPGLYFYGSVGETFELDEIELLEFDTGAYVKNLYDPQIPDT